MSDTMRKSRPHCRCGICDEPIQRSEPTKYVADERCHRECAEDEEARLTLDPHPNFLRAYLSGQYDEGES